MRGPAYTMTFSHPETTTEVREWCSSEAVPHVELDADDDDDEEYYDAECASAREAAAETALEEAEEISLGCAARGEELEAAVISKEEEVRATAISAELATLSAELAALREGVAKQAEETAAASAEVEEATKRYEEARDVAEAEAEADADREEDADAAGGAGGVEGAGAGAGAAGGAGACAGAGAGAGAGGGAGPGPGAGERAAGTPRGGARSRAGQPQPALERHTYAAALVVGMQFEMLSAFCEVLGMGKVSSRKFYAFQKTFGSKVMDMAAESKAEALEKCRGREVMVGTDAQYDTSRFGMYCIVTFIDMLTWAVVATCIVTRQDPELLEKWKGATKMSETLATRRALAGVPGQGGYPGLIAELRNRDGAKIVEVVHDNNSSVDLALTELLPYAWNSKDLWHEAKNKIIEIIRQGPATDSRRVNRHV